MKRSKAYNNCLTLIEKGKKYDALKACELAKETTKVKYDATIRVSFSLNVDPRQADQQIRGAMVLPNGTGRSQKILVITRGANVDVALKAGADYAGEKEMIDKIKGGWFDYDIIVATPDMMGELGKIGKILGPKGLMPNPKTGTVTPNISHAVEEIKKGKVQYRVDKEGNINCLIGKSSFTAEQLAGNFNALAAVIQKAKPAAVKGTYIKSCTISSNMGPGIKVEI